MTNNYKLIENYASDENYLNDFHQFMSIVFPGANFRKWEEKGFWTDNYIPLSLISAGKIISNVCASLMKIIISGKEYSAVQFGAVGTLPEFRNKGLSKRLMNYAIKTLEPKADFFFLFANETVLNFYPKFGFNKFDEYLFIKNVDPVIANPQTRKLDVDDQNDYTILQILLSNRIPVTKIFGAAEYQPITMWHIFNIYRDDLYYLERDSAIIIMREKENELYIFDVICSEKIDVDSITPKLIHSKSVSKVKLYFPPDQLKFNYDKIEKESTDLFIRGSITLPAEPFRFPVTATT